MNLFAQILYANQTSTTDFEGIIYNSADVYISIANDDGIPANGDYMAVTVAYNNNGVITDSDYTVPGQTLKIYSGVISRKLPSQTTPFDIRSFAVVNTLPPGIPGPAPSVCDATISAISIDKKESSPGAADGQVTINATSSHGPIQYSLDGADFQSSATFTGLGGGSYTAYIRDANSCTANRSFTLLTVRNLLVSDPSVDLGNGNISRWSAAFNPVVFIYQRKDFEVTTISQDSLTQKPLIGLNAVVSSVKIGELIYLNAGPYKGVYPVLQVYENSLIIDTPYITPSTTAGFMNINSLRPYYKILTYITCQDPFTGQQQTIQSTNRPDSTGLIKADISNFLQSLLRAKDASDFTLPNFRDDNLYASYQVQYAESWDDGTANGYTSALIDITNPYYVVYAAKQLGQQYGGNLAAYVPFASVTDSSQLAKWISDFNEPAYSNGYPFDIGFIYSEYLLGLNIYCELTLLDINRNPIPGDSQTDDLLNEDGSWLLNEDASKFIIAGQTISDTTLPDQLGLNRLLINTTFPPEAYYFTIALKYADEHSTHTITQTQTIRIDDAVDERSVYLRWIGLSGTGNTKPYLRHQAESTRNPGNHTATTGR